MKEIRIEKRNKNLRNHLSSATSQDNFYALCTKHGVISETEHATFSLILILIFKVRGGPLGYCLRLKQKNLRSSQWSQCLNIKNEKGLL